MTRILAQASLALLLMSTTPAASSQVKAPLAAHHAGWSDKSYYLAMRDGTRLALSLYFANGAEPTRPATTVLFQTRYGRAGHFANRAGGDPQRWREAGFVVAVVDTRGSTASFGPRDVDIGPDEVADMDELVAHLASRPWSDGKVVAAGVSYMADTADWSTTRPLAALLGAVPRETDFDAWAHLFFPGGVKNDYMLNRWGGYTREIDFGRDGGSQNLDCRLRAVDCPKLFPTLQPVDDDTDFSLAREAMNGRKHWGPEDYSDTTFRDELGRNGYSLFNSSPSSDLAGIRRARKPVQYWGSWVDGGTAEAALARYRSAPEVPMEVWITTNNHSHTVGADPLKPGQLTALPTPEAQFDLNRKFVEALRQGKATPRVIHYYPIGADAPKSTAIWPPQDAAKQFLAFDAGHSLRTGRAKARGADRYKVDFSATTGKATRWTTQFGVAPAYPDRRDEDRKLLTYDGPPMAVDTEVVGTPVVNLWVAAETTDPAFFVYLEDVAPDGRVTYLTEGEFRALHRKPADPKAMPYDQGPAPHSFARVDAMPATPGAVMQVKFALWPTAAVVRRGHRLRVAIAGADKDTFHRYSEGRDDTFTLHRGGTRTSGIEINQRPWRE